MRAGSAMALAALLAGAVVAEPVTTFKSRVPYPALVKKLEASGGDVARVLHPRVLADLAALEDGRRYKFALTVDGHLAIAPFPFDSEHKEYVHPILAGGAPVLTAGGISIARADGQIRSVTIDQNSTSYCPTLESLAAVEPVLVRLGVPRTAIVRRDERPKCEAPPAAM